MLNAKLTSDSTSLVNGFQSLLISYNQGLLENNIPEAEILDNNNK